MKPIPVATSAVLFQPDRMVAGSNVVRWLPGEQVGTTIMGKLTNGAGSNVVRWLLGEQRNQFRESPVQVELITSLPDDQHRILQPIKINYEKISDIEIVARFEEANIAISGFTRQDAFQALIEEILVAFDDWTADSSALGPGPQQQLAVLQRHIGKA